MIIRKLILAVLVSLGLTPAYAVSIAITNAKIYTLTKQGTIANGTLVVADGRIIAMGVDTAVPNGVEVIDAKGGSVTPGLINSDTHIGVEEISAIKQTVDSATKNTQITAALKVADAFNYNSVLIPHNRMHGLTRAIVMPSSGSSLIAGQAAIVDLSGEQGGVINSYAAMVVNLGEEGKKLAGGSRAAAIMQLRAALEDARDFRAYRDDFNRRQRRQYALSRHDLAALVPVVNGIKPMLVRVHREAEIRRTLQFAAEQKIKLILAGAAEAWLLADEIAATGVPVIIDPIYNTPSRYESLGARADNAALLHKAGVKLMFTGMAWRNTHSAYLVRQSAGNAVANGLPKEAAIAAMSKNPAEVFSIAGGYGSLSVGGKADLVLWQADPLEVGSEALIVLLKGERVSLVSRSTRLAQRYYEKIRRSVSNP